MPAAGRISNNTSQTPLISLSKSTANGRVSPMDCVRACHLATIGLSPKIDIVAWEILQLAHGADNGFSYTAAHCYLNRTNGNTIFAYSNKSMYSAINRLLLAGYLTERVVNSKGWRRWYLSSKGTALVGQLNKKALEIIQGWQQQAAVSGGG
jgi:hypothetical protein